MTVKKVRRQRLGRVSQGDIYRDVKVIDYVIEKRGNIEISRIYDFNFTKKIGARHFV